MLIPERLNGRLTKNNSRLFKLILMVLVLITGLYTREYRGEFEHTINTSAGGIFYVLFGSLGLSVLFPALKPGAVSILAFGLTCMVEGIQYFRFPFMLQLAQYKIPAYLFGSSYNPADFIYYGVGAVCSVLVLGLIWKNEGPEIGNR